MITLKESHDFQGSVAVTSLTQHSWLHQAAVFMDMLGRRRRSPRGDGIFTEKAVWISNDGLMVV